MPWYGPPPPAYSSPQMPSPYHVPPTSVPYPHPQAQQQQSHASHEYGQPAYPGWRGPYYNAHAQQLDLILGLLTPSQLNILLTKVATISNNSVAVYHLSILAI